MPLRLFVSFWIIATAVQAQTVVLTVLERDVYEATNLLRTQPRAFIPDLLRLRARFRGKRMQLGFRTWLETSEGTAAIDEALTFLKYARPVPKLRLSPSLIHSARDQVRDQIHSGLVGHFGRDGSSPRTRMRRYAEILGKSGENISYGGYGGHSGRDIVLGLLIDDGEKTRGHRVNLFDPSYAFTGVACGPHRRYLYFCVMDLVAQLYVK